MIPNRIEREVMIEAPVATVWRIVTEPTYITEWFGDEIEMDARPEGKGTLTFYSGDGESHKTQPFTVDAIEPTSRFAMRWCYEESVDRPAAGNSLLIEFLLSDEGDKTRLQVIESGFDTINWDASTAKATYDDHTNGWNVIVGRLEEYARRLND
jgi:uncharacterized protein YndB with AHSA1/START domain